MRSTFKVLFYVNGSKEKNGIVPIMGRVTINGSVAQFSCKLTISKTMWDAKGNRAKGKSKEARDINLALDNIKAQIIKHYQRISDREAFVTAEMVRNAYQGSGFSFIGNQHTLTCNDKEYRVDLLFFHRRLRSMVAIELKIGEFKPEYVGKMNFYLSLLDKLEKAPDENPSIGIILCAEKDHLEVELALQDVNKPIGVAEYQYLLPKNKLQELVTNEMKSSGNRDS